jgi:hypothetical protein
MGANCPRRDRAPGAGAPPPPAPAPAPARGAGTAVPPAAAAGRAAIRYPPRGAPSAGPLALGLRPTSGSASIRLRCSRLALARAALQPPPAASALMPPAAARGGRGVAARSPASRCWAAGRSSAMSRGRHWSAGASRGAPPRARARRRPDAPVRDRRRAPSAPLFSDQRSGKCPRRRRRARAARPSRAPQQAPRGGADRGAACRPRRRRPLDAAAPRAASPRCARLKRSDACVVGAAISAAGPARNRQARRHSCAARESAPRQRWATTKAACRGAQAPRAAPSTRVALRGGLLLHDVSGTTSSTRTSSAPAARCPTSRRAVK